jgi:hypothetical protein
MEWVVDSNFTGPLGSSAGAVLTHKGPDLQCGSARPLGMTFFSRANPRSAS